MSKTVSYDFSITNFVTVKAPYGVNPDTLVDQAKKSITLSEIEFHCENTYDQETGQYEPIPEELDSESSKYIIGAQGNVWTEYMSTSEYVEYMVFPRIFALSEVVWSKNKSNFEEFTSRVTSFFDRLDKLSINYSTHLERIN